MEGAGRRLHACVPSTTAQAKIDEATASAVGGELALAFAEITECGGSDDLESQVRKLAGRAGELAAHCALWGAMGGGLTWS